MASAHSGVVLRHIRDLLGANAPPHLLDRELLARFALGQEEAAFEALVRRHGPLVFGVCRRVLNNWHDAEDAFQATFLILARKARSIDKQGSVGSWLHQVAYHAAIKAKARVTERQQRERQGREPLTPDALEEVTGRELLAALDEELQRLPERLRMPLVLCYLEGKTRDEAAFQLGWSLGTLKRRLEQGRERLQGRLTRRGLTLSAGLVTAGLFQGGATAAVPPLLAYSTVKAAMMIAAGKAVTAGLVSTSAAGLVKGVLHGMFAGKIKIAAVSLLLVGMLGLGAGIAVRQFLAERQGAVRGSPDPGRDTTGGLPRRKGDPRSDERAGSGHASVPDPRPAQNPRPARSPANPPQANKKNVIVITGKVLDPDGKPVPEALVGLLTYQKDQRGMPTEENMQMDVLGQGQTDGEGKVQLKVPRVVPPPSLEIMSGQMIASAKGYAVGLEGVDLNAERAEVVIRLKPERPIRGRFIDLQGAGVKGLQVRVAAVTEEREPQRVAVMAPSTPLSLWPAPLVTDAAGRYVIRGFGKGQQLYLVVRGDRFAEQILELGAVTEDPSKEVTKTLTLAQVIEGRVTYSDTGKAVENAKVHVQQVMRGNAHTDKDGHYRLNVEWDRDPWMNFMDVLPPPGEPYLGRVHQLQEKPKGGVKLQVDLDLPRGVIVRGKVTEAGTGKSVAGAEVYYIALQSNQGDLQRKGLTLGEVYPVRSGIDGSFQIVVLSGQGTLLVEGPSPDYILIEIGQNQLFENKPGGNRRYVHALLPLNLKQSNDPQEVAVQLRRGVTVKGTVVGLDGQAVSGVQMFSRLNTSASMAIKDEVRGVPLADGRFEFNSCDPEKAYPVIFLDEKNQWGAKVELSGKKADSKPMTIQLVRCGSAVARFVNAARKPLVGHSPMLEMLVTAGPRAFEPGVLAADSVLMTNIYRQHYRYPEKPRTDAQGRCTFPALIPGVTYRIENDGRAFDFTVKSGEIVDLKDIVVPKGG